MIPLILNPLANFLILTLKSGSNTTKSLKLSFKYESIQFLGKNPLRIFPRLKESALLSD